MGNIGVGSSSETITNNEMILSEFVKSGGGTGIPPYPSALVDFGHESSDDDDNGIHDYGDMVNISAISDALELTNPNLSKWCKLCDFKGCDVCHLKPPFDLNFDVRCDQTQPCFSEQILIRYMFDINSLKNTLATMCVGPCLTKADRKNRKTLNKKNKLPICPEDIYHVYAPILDIIIDDSYKRIERLRLIKQICENVFSHYTRRCNATTLNNWRYCTVFKYMTAYVDASGHEIDVHCREIAATISGK